MTKTNTEYEAQLDIQKYAEQQRKHINQFLQKHKPKFLTLPEARRIIQDTDFKGAIWAIIDPNIVQMLSYEPVRLVRRILKATPYDKEFLTDYWLEKYEIELEESYGDWEFKVGLYFISDWWDEYRHDVVSYSRTYDYPSCIISTFLLIGSK